MLKLIFVLFHLELVKSSLFEFKTNNNFSFPGRVLKRHVIQEFSTKSQVTQCAMQCFRTPGCKSFNFEQRRKHCQLNNASHVEFPQHFYHESQLDVEYHLIEAFSIQEEAKGPCASHPCQHGGSCYDTKSSKGKRMYICVACDTGWTGRNCHIKEKTLEWAAWQTWGKCSVSCGHGFRMRRRRCEEVGTGIKYSAEECYGRETDYGTCDYIECPRWMEWSGWGNCSTYTTCGRGYKVRHRNCSNGGNAGVDRYCKGPSNESAACEGLSCKGALRLDSSNQFGEGTVALHNDQIGRWIYVCGEQWDLKMADIACKQTGFLGANEAMLNKTMLDESYKLRCSGEEKTLHKCLREKSGSCNSVAGVKCKVKGAWSLWSAWSDCSVTCENGTRIRNRNCSNPPPNNNGEPCPGSYNDYKDCSLQACPVDGVWLLWSLWSECSVTCENGIKNRSRECIGPYHGGKPCDGSKEDVATCFPKMCPVDGIWDMWTEWSECTVTCGYGTRNRNRTCIGPYYDGAKCVGPTGEIGSCNTFSCPVDGNWKLWTDWEPCSVTCGGGTQNRTRECILPKHGGKTCIGPSLETAVCNSFYCPVDGVWTSWEQWTDCTASCGYGTKFRERYCYGPFYDGNLCEGECNQTESCNAFSCPVDGSWKIWVTWDDCSVTCGGGKRNRTRECNLPKHGGQNCIGPPLDTEPCNEHECPVDGMWKLWSSWDSCSVTCGGGIKNRTRVCINPKHGGETCTGPSIQSVRCNDFECPIDGIWSEWTFWDECNATCGGGLQSRYRECEGPFNGGNNCTGVDMEKRDCNSQFCPVDGVWNVWSNWTQCSLTCGNGTQSRNRTCTGPYHGGLNCSGDENDVRDCNTFYCPVDGYFEPWAEWERCSITCGSGGTKWRRRHCNPPKHGGRDCVGKHNESTDCSLYHCPVDCIWLQWSKWGECSRTCGNGTQFRVRDFTGPFFNGKNCTGSPKQEIDCNVFECPVDGYWSEWSEWQACSQSCGRGNKLRNRTCIGPFHKGKDCVGDYNETSYCNPSSCPVDGEWYTWGNWHACNATCGGGIKKRYRQCDGPYHGGKNCIGDDLDSDICEDFPCPVDGIWKPWSEWTYCNVSCGGGSNQRHRICDGPYHGGSNCTGDVIQIKSCNTNNCPIDGKFTGWSDWDECNVTCGGGVQWRNRSCIGPFHGGLDCDGNYTESRQCNEQKCPVDGTWKEWSSWDTCNVTCGGGIHWRQRHCDGPYYGGHNCTGNYNESKTCNDLHCPVDGVWEKWTSWQECNVTCGGGYQLRHRNCTQPRYGGSECEGNSTEKRECNIDNCPVDGVFTIWSAWEECNISCGGGIQWRNRTCDGPYFGGKPCSGKYRDHTDCNSHPCPIDGVWKPWSVWDSCPVTCGGSFINRTRECDGPFHGGEPCRGNATEQDICGTDPCPIPGEWQDWQAWSRCSVSCNGGKRLRQRECNMTSYGDLTIPCLGVNTTVETCHTFPCTPYARHCSQLVEFGLLDNVEATIDPDGEGGIEPINVICDVDDEGGKGVTIIGHDNENRTSIFGFEGGKMIILKYDVPEGIITYIIDHSQACKQFLLWECKGAVIHNPFQASSWTTFWTNRTSNDNIAPGSQYKSAGYFPGANKGSGKCACGMTNSCYDPTKDCNCDANDKNIWLSDGGYLTYKEDLPVVAFFAGDTGDEAIENGYFTIGPIKCWGYAT